LISSKRDFIGKFIATNRTDTMDSVLEKNGLEEYFDLVVCAMDVKLPKPDPESLLKILDHFKIDSDQLVYVGDSKLDEVASNAANVPFIAYRNKGLTADYHISQLVEIKGILAG